MINTFADNQNLKTTLLDLSSQQFDSLKQVGTYYRLVRALRATGWTNLFWGGVTLWLGTSAIYPNIFTNIQAILGFLIVAQSLWAITRPSANGFLALTCILLFCGLWNLFITFYNGYIGFAALIGLLGVFQLWWAYRTYKSFQLFSELPAVTPTSELAQQYDTIWEGLAHPSPALSPELIMMQLNRNRYWWNGLLLPDHAILAHKRQKVLLFVSKPELTIVAENSNAINRDKFAVFAQIGKESLVGKIYRGGFQQYLQWKGIANSEMEVDRGLKRKRVGRKMLRWIMIVIIIGFLLLLVPPIMMILQYGR
jgi:hypothetical protein